MQKSKKSAFILLGSLVSVVASADNSAMSYSYLSGGAVYDKSGWSKPLADFFGKGTGNIVDVSAHPKALTPKSSSLGGYLHGSYALDDHLFLEAKLGYLGGRKNGYFVGVGYHVPVTSNSDIYVLGGISQPDLPAKVQLNQKGKALFKKYPNNVASAFMKVVKDEVRNYITSTVGIGSAGLIQFLMLDVLNNNGAEVHSGETIEGYIERFQGNRDDVVEKLTEKFESHLSQKTVDESAISLKSKIAPTLEFGYRISVNDQLGAKVAYRSSYDSVRMQGKLFNPIRQEMIPINHKKQGLSHEGTVEANYTFTPNLLAEAGYTLSKMFTIEAIRPKMGHRFNLGLRYVF